MAVLRLLAVLIGILVTAAGLLFFAQGLGIIHWPRSSFMLDQSRWALYGAVIALVGLAILFGARRLR